MKIRFNGAARTVTGSQYLLTINNHLMLLECGMYQGKRAETYARNRSFSFNIRDLEAVVLSHAHIDHSGNLPNLVKQGYHGPIFATRGTAALADLMLRDSGHIQESDAEFVNKKRAKEGLDPIEPLYTSDDAARVTPLFCAREYHTPFSPIPGVTVEFFDAGHILGSAGMAIDIEENGRKFRLWFSGDIGRPGLPLLRDPELPQRPDYMMMECTYGDKPHENPEDAYVEFRDVVARTIKRGGKVIIPAFAVGRTQELVYDINRLVSDNELPNVPVYVDSPLAVGASQIFSRFDTYFDEETRQFVREERHPALNFNNLHYISKADDSKKINDLRGPAIIMSASGMAENGRILHHLRNNIEDPRNMILIVGWQAPYTLGRRLADRERKVRIFGEEFIRKADVETIGGLSAHAGQNYLMTYARAALPTVKTLFLVHGEEDAEGAFEGLLREEGFSDIRYPDWGEEVEI